MEMEIDKPRLSLTDLRLALNGWADYADDYALVAELIPQYSEISMLISSLGAINKQLGEDSTISIFDGRISRLKRLVDTGKVSLDKISDSLVRKTAEKYLKGLSEEDRYKVSANRWSPQALRCKAISIGLWLYSGKLQINKKASSVISTLESLNERDFPLLEDDVKNGKLSSDRVAKMTQINSMWIALVDDKEVPAKTLADIVTEDAFSDQGYTAMVIQTDLLDIIEAAVTKNFPEGLGDKSVTSALRKAIAVILYSAGRYRPDSAKRHSAIRFDGILSKDFEYIFDEEGGYQDWFVEYFTVELNRRCRLINSLRRNGFTWKFGGSSRKYVSYLPLFDGFRFWSADDCRGAVFGYKILNDKDLPIEDRNLIARNLVFAMQQLVSEPIKESDDGQFAQLESAVKDGFISLLLVAMKPLGKTIFRRNRGFLPSEPEEVSQVITTEFLDAVMEYDPAINSSFFGYIKAVWELKAKASVRPKKTEEVTTYTDQNEDFGTSESLIAEAEISLLKSALEKALSDLTPKVRSALEKRFSANEKMTDAERKAAYRGLKQLAKDHPELKSFL